MMALHLACEGPQRLDGARQDACATSTSGAAAQDDGRMPRGGSHAFPTLAQPA